MVIVGFLQNRNGVNNGFLRNCLRSMRCLADHILVSDDASTEDVWALYREFDCVVIPHRQSFFERELYLKQELLVFALQFRPDWILWFDADAILGQFWEDRARAEQLLSSSVDKGYARLHLHNLNLWRTNGHFRTDHNFNDLWHGVWWYNTGELFYHPTTGLHRKQYPISYVDPQRGEQAYKIEPRIVNEFTKLLHFGFATDVEIARKYFTYRERGQKGYALERLVEEAGRVLEPVNPKWFPEWYTKENPIDTESPAVRFSAKEMAKYGSFAEWERANPPG